MIHSYFYESKLVCYRIALADADPLGVNVNVTFDEVGGLDDRMFFSLSYQIISLRYYTLSRH